MLLLMVSGSLLRGHPWLEVPNLLGSTFYGLRAFRQGASLATLSGTALHFTITGVMGGLFGLVFGGVRQRRRLILLGVLAGVAWYYLADAVFWSRVNPLVPLYGPFYSPPAATFLAHALFGACLGYMGQGYMGRGHMGPDAGPHSAQPPPLPPLPEEPAEPSADALE